MIITNILLVAVFIGVLITIHEFGHFIVAKLARIPVEVFSVGFGPKVLRKRWGGTEYCVSVIPLGGYIKMVGEDDPTKGGFTDRPLWVRVAVIAAGPLFNLLLGFLMLLVMYLSFGIGYTAPVVDPHPGSAVARSGLAVGDTVLSAAGEAITSFEQFEVVLQQHAGSRIALVVSNGASPRTLDYDVPAGYGGASPAAVVGAVRAGSPAEQAGLQPGDTIVEAAGAPVTGWQELVEAVRNHDAERIPLGWRRNGETLGDTVGTYTEPDEETGKPVRRLGIEVDLSWYLEPHVAAVAGRIRSRSPAARAGLRPGDTITAIAGVAVSRWTDFTEAVNAHPGETVLLEWRRAGRPYSDSVTAGTERDQLTGEARGEIGVWPEMPRHRLSLPVAAWEAVRRSGYIVGQTFVVIYRVIARQIPAKAIGGPIMVAKIAYDGASWGAEYFLALWALLSMNLFVVNMLPIPVLDGGRIVLFAVESARRRRLSERELAWAMNVGWVMIGIVVVIVLFNDVVRLIR